MKYYFMCEGEYGKSEYMFINSVISEFRVDEEYELIAVGGKENIELGFIKCKKDFCSGDVFILFFDNIETVGNKPTVYLLNSLDKQCRDLGVRFRYSTYYCFEELFLSYLNLFSILNEDETILSELHKIQSKLMTGVNYFKDDISFWEEYFGKHRKGVLRTRESLSAGICNDILSRAKGSFYLQKSKIGYCWISDCESTKLHKNIYIYDSCRYKLKGCSFREKLADLDKNSVSKFSLPFSTIFD